MIQPITPPANNNKSRQESVIPRIIHYCWFGDKKLDRFAKNCIKSWRKYLPGYEIKCWNNDSLADIDSEFVKAAIADKRWAFVADYVRLYALYTEGGVYFDTDVKLYSDMRGLLNRRVVIPTQESVTTGHNLMSAVIATEPRHPFIKECLDFYSELEYDPENYRSVVINPIMSKILHNKWGYAYEDKTQELADGILILDRTYFESDFSMGDRKKSDYYGVHFCNQSWIPSNRGKIYTFCKENDLMGIYKVLTKLFK